MSLFSKKFKAVSAKLDWINRIPKTRLSCVALVMIPSVISIAELPPLRPLDEEIQKQIIEEKQMKQNKQWCSDWAYFSRMLEPLLVEPLNRCRQLCPTNCVLMREERRCDLLRLVPAIRRCFAFASSALQYCRVQLLSVFRTIQVASQCSEESP